MEPDAQFIKKQELGQHGGHTPSPKYQETQNEALYHHGKALPSPSHHHS